jgi:hypothetical protein
LYFRAQVGSLDVRALEINERPTLKAKLFRAPYWNVNDQGTGAYAQVHRDALVNELKGKEAVAVVRIGSKGVPSGLSEPFPVNTLAYPDGRVEYRVELGRVNTNAI